MNILRSSRRGETAGKSGHDRKAAENCSDGDFRGQRRVSYRAQADSGALPFVQGRNQMPADFRIIGFAPRREKTG